MNRDEIIRIARVAGFEIDCCSLEWHNRIERFAALVAAAAKAEENEACAKECEAYWHIDGTDTALAFAATVRARGQK